MLRAKDISFFQLMEAGYLSPESYRALKPKSIFSELSHEECKNYPSNVCHELECLFEDKSTVESICYLENIEHDVRYNFLDLEKLLDEVLDLASHQAIKVVNKVGKKIFLTDYIFCSSTAISRMYYIEDSNIDYVNEVRDHFRQKYAKWLSNDTVDTNDNESTGNKVDNTKPNYDNTYRIIDDNEDTGNNMVSESLTIPTIVSGEGFELKDQFELEESFLNSIKEEYRKYVLFLYSLNCDEFASLSKYLLSEIKKTPNRTSNGIKKIGLRKFYVRYLFANEIDLLSLKNFGPKSLFDLNKVKQDIIDLVIKCYNNSNISSIENVVEAQIGASLGGGKSLLELIGPTNYNYLQLELDKIKKGLSVRAQNAINTFKGDFIEEFVYNQKDIRSIKKIGRKTEIEFQYLIESLKNILDGIPKEDISEETLEKNKKIAFYENCYDEACAKFLENEGHLPMFYILERYLRKCVYRNTLKIVNMHTPLFAGVDSYSYEDIASAMKLTRERIRQIYAKGKKKLSSIDINELEEKGLNYSKLLSQKDDWQYIVDKLNDYDFISTSDIQEIVSEEHCQLSYWLIMVVLQTIHEEFIILEQDPVAQRTKQKTTWNNSYLIKKSISDSFDFNEMISLIHEYEENNTESISLSIEELLTDTFFSAWKEYDYLLVDPLQNIVSQILINELGIIPDLDYRFTIEGKKQERPEDVLYDILQSNASPMDIDALFAMYEDKYPKRYKSSYSLRAIINRDPRICLVSMTNQVTLKEWEHIATGSIRDLIVSFLAEHAEPQHISNIVTHILSLRDTTERSIYSTMRSGNQFSKFSGGYFGLADRTYSDWFNLSEGERTARRLIVLFEQFLQKHNRFPLNQAFDNEETALYLWWNRIKRRTNLSNELQERIKMLETKYSELPRSKAEFIWQQNCNAYKKFVETNHRKPSEKIPHEADLAVWYAKNLNDLIDGNLSSEKEPKFVNLCKSL